jgi:hypothetical protein
VGLAVEGALAGHPCAGRPGRGDRAVRPVPIAPVRAARRRRRRRIVHRVHRVGRHPGRGGLPVRHGGPARERDVGKTTVALRLAAEAQAAGAIVAWLDLARAFDPVEAVARGVRPEWLVVLTPVDLEEALTLSAALLAARTVDLLVVDLPDGRDPAVARARVGDRLGRLAALARRAGTLLVVVEPSALGRGLRPPWRRRAGCAWSWSGRAGSGWAGTWWGSAAR